MHGCVEERIHGAHLLCNLTFTVEVDGDVFGKPCRLLPAHALIDGSAVYSQTGGVFHGIVVILQPVEHGAEAGMCRPCRSLQRAVGRQQFPGATFDPMIRVEHFLQRLGPVRTGFEHIHVPGRTAIQFKLPQQLAPFRAGGLAITHAAHVLEDIRQGGCRVGGNLGLLASQRRAAEVEQSALHISQQVDWAEQRVVLGVDRTEITGDLRADAEQTLQALCVQVLHGLRHPQRARIVLVEFDGHLGNLAVRAAHLGDQHIVPAAIQRIDALHNLAQPRVEHLGLRRLCLNGPKPLDRMFLDQTHQGRRHDVLFPARNCTLAFLHDVGQHIHHFAQRTSPALRFLAADTEPLANSSAASLALTHQRDVVLEQIFPAVHRFLIFQAIFHIQLPCTLNDCIHLFGDRFQFRLGGRGQLGEILVGIGILHAGSAVCQIWVVGVALGNNPVRLLGVAGMQKFLHVSNGQIAGFDQAHQRPQLVVGKLFRACCRPALEQSLL